MIYAASKPIEEYVVSYHGKDYGLFLEYGDNPPLLALIMIMTPYGYWYEMNLPSVSIPAALTNRDLATESLDYEVSKGVRLSTMLTTLNPLQFCEIFNAIPEEDLEDLPLIADIPGVSVGGIKAIVGARAANWATNYRGKVTESGNKISLAFQGIPVPDALKAINEEVRSAVREQAEEIQNAE